MEGVPQAPGLSCEWVHVPLVGPGIGGLAPSMIFWCEIVRCGQRVDSSSGQSSFRRRFFFIRPYFLFVQLQFTSPSRAAIRKQIWLLQLAPYNIPIHFQTRNRKILLVPSLTPLTDNHLEQFWNSRPNPSTVVSS
ncbi:hypothetical protein B0H10DRAFT_2091779, partial [Mycena sp. CBHHK59/15]